MGGVPPYGGGDDGDLPRAQHHLAQPGMPERRESMLRGVIDDVEIGLDSDIQSITSTRQVVRPFSVQPPT